MARANQYTYNWSTEVYSISQQKFSEPENNQMEALENDPPENPIYAIDPINLFRPSDVRVYARAKVVLLQIFRRRTMVRR